MLETPHILVGATIAFFIPNPFVSLPLSLISHFVLDLIPHWNPQIHTELSNNGKVSLQSKIILGTDVILSLIIVFFVLYEVWPDVGHVITIFVACLLAIFPDLFQVPYYFFNKESAWTKIIVDFQAKNQSHVSVTHGILAQVLVSLTSLILLLSNIFK